MKTKTIVFSIILISAISVQKCYTKNSTIHIPAWIYAKFDNERFAPLMARADTVQKMNHFNDSTITIFTILDKIIKADEKLYLIYDLDIFKYFELSQYDTDLKKAVFKKTPEYTEKLNELQLLKTKILTSTYYSYQENLFENVNYDLNKKGFEVKIGECSGMGTFGARPPKTCAINNTFKFIYLKSLPSKRVSFNDFLLIPLDETTGLEIENDKANINIYYLYTPIGKEIVYFQYMDVMSGGVCNLNNNLLKSNKVRVIVANKVNGKIYFDKTY